VGFHTINCIGNIHCVIVRVTGKKREKRKRIYEVDQMKEEQKEKENEDVKKKWKEDK
jgi:hypothetical protein